MVDEALGAWAEGRVKDLALRLSARDLTVAVAESLTGGLVTEVLARGPDASRWLRPRLSPTTPLRADDSTYREYNASTPAAGVRRA